MAHRTDVPKFGNWDNQDNVPYTVFFEKAGKNRGKKMINPNDPQQNPRMDPSPVAPRPASRPRPTPNESIGRAAVRLTADHKPIKEQKEINLKQFSSSTARSENASHRIIANESIPGTRGQRPVGAARPNAGFEHRSERFPSNNNHLPAKGTVSTGWDDSSHGKYRQKPPHGDESSWEQNEPNRGVAVPKFGEWNENDPQSAAKFTHIFNKVREEKNNEAGHYKVAARPSVAPTKKCCFPWW